MALILQNNYNRSFFMKSVLTVLAVLSFSAFANQSVYELIRVGEVSYYVGSSCKTFFTDPKKRKVLQSDKIRKAFKTPSSLGFNNFFYHYTNNTTPLDLLLHTETDRKKAEYQIDKDGGYSTIFKYQMTYSDALSNAAGVGFYVSGNPVTSADYGSYQIQLKVKANTNIFDYNTDIDLFKAEINRMKTEAPEFASCSYDIQMSVVSDENDADLVYYSTGSQWFVGFNEDIFVESKITRIASQYQSTIFRKMAEAGEFESLINYVDIVQPKSPYTIPLTTLLSYYDGGSHAGIKGANGVADMLLKTMPVKSNEISYLSLLKSVDQGSVAKYYNIFARQSRTFTVAFINTDIVGLEDEILKQYTIALRQGYKPDDSVLSIKNLQHLYSKNHLSSSELTRRINSTVKFSDLYGTYNAVEYRAGIGSLIVDDMLENSLDHFKALTENEKYSIFNYYMKYAREDKIKSFINTISLAGYPLESSFNYSISRASSYKYDNLQVFAKEYINTNKELLVDTSVMSKVRTIIANSEQQDMSFLQLTLNNITENKSIFDTYLATYLSLKPNETLDLLSKSSLSSHLDLLSKRNIYFEIIRNKGLGSSEYHNFLSNAQVDIDAEFNYFQNTYDLSEDDQVILYRKFQRYSSTREKLTNILESDSALYIFKAKTPSSKLIQSLISDYSKEILSDLDVAKKTRSINIVMAKEIVNYEYFKRSYNSFSNEDKMYYLLENYKVFSDIGITRSLLSQIEINEDLASKFISFVSSNNDSKYTELVHLVIDNEEVLYKASESSYKSYFYNLIKSSDLLDKHTDILMNQRLSTDKFLVGMRYFENLSTEFLTNIAAVKLRDLKISSINLTRFAKYYQDKYQGHDKIKIAFWDIYFEQFKGNASKLLSRLDFRLLDLEHRVDILTLYSQSETQINLLDDIIYKSKDDDDDYNYDYNIAVFDTKDDNSIRALMPRLDIHYPQKNMYIDKFMEYYIRKGKPVFMKAHITNKLCEKIDRYKGLKYWYRRWDNRDEKRQRWAIYKDECR